MKHLALIATAMLALAGPSRAGSIAGAQDGTYRAADGDTIDVASADRRVGVDGRDCLGPTVQGGRIVSRTCWGNGHLGSDLDAAWQVEGDVVTLAGKRYVLQIAPARAGRPVAASRPSTDQVEPSGRPWRHNGSIVMADPGTGIIAYLEPKASLRPVVQEGTVLFRGAVHPDRPVRGTAYAYREGCAPAPYPVQGTDIGLDRLTLRGAGPVRRGCAVIGYSERSPHAVLRFSYLLDA